MSRVSWGHGEEHASGRKKWMEELRTTERSHEMRTEKGALNLAKMNTVSELHESRVSGPVGTKSSWSGLEREQGLIHYSSQCRPSLRAQPGPGGCWQN